MSEETVLGEPVTTVAPAAADATTVLERHTLGVTDIYKRFGGIYRFPVQSNMFL